MKLLLNTLLTVLLLGLPYGAQAITVSFNQYTSGVAPEDTAYTLNIAPELADIGQFSGIEIEIAPVGITRFVTGATNLKFPTGTGGTSGFNASLTLFDNVFSPAPPIVENNRLAGQFFRLGGSISELTRDYLDIVVAGDEIPSQAFTYNVTFRTSTSVYQTFTGIIETNPQPVPLPAGGALLIGALAVFGGLRQRAKKS